jgi:hypothetical protein
MRLTELLPLLSECMGHTVAPALTLWISDPDRRLGSHDYTRLVMPGYTYVLVFVQSLPRTPQTVHKYGKLLGSIKNRMKEIPKAVTSFQEFWERNYVEVFRNIDTPHFVSDLLHFCDPAQIGQEGANNKARVSPIIHAKLSGYQLFQEPPEQGVIAAYTLQSQRPLGS